MNKIVGAIIVGKGLQKFVLVHSHWSAEIFGYFLLVNPRNIDLISKQLIL